MEEWLRYVSIFSVIVAGSLAAHQYRFFHLYPARAMAWYIFFQAFFEVESAITAYIDRPNVIHYYIYCIAETLLVPILIAKLQYMKPYRKGIYLFLSCLIVSMLVEIFYSWPDKVNTITRVIECLFLVVLSNIVFSVISLTPRRAMRFNLEEFWLCAAIAFYFSFHALVIMFTNISIEKFGYDFGRKIWLFNSIASILSNILLILGIWKIYLRQPSSRA